ncbi:MAG: hypothetical protein NDI60_02015 [Elusimicrobiales bacterium]|nr:hypothetical protein [Elusimicrobiales bacterium]
MKDRGLFGRMAVGFVVLALCALQGSFLTGCRRRASDLKTWHVMVAALPEKVLKDNLGEGTVTYIFRQTHEPLFRLEDGQNFRSKVLSRWSRSIDAREFMFCPNQEMRLRDDIRFTAEYLRDFLVKNAAKFGGNPDVSESQGCVYVKFPESQPGYLAFMSSYFNAPSVEDGGISYGLGQFSVKAVSREEVELVRKAKIPDGYNKIVFHAYAGPDDPRLKDGTISDFNKLSSFQQPEWIKSEYLGFDNVELRVVGLAISHADPEVRSVLYNCINVDEFRRAVVPARKDFYDVQTVLPVGVPGSRGGRPKQACHVARHLRGKEVILANPRTDNIAQLAEFSRGFFGKTGMRLNVRQYKPEEMNPMIYDKVHRRPYNLVLVVTENSSPDQDGFFAFYAGEARAADHVPAEVLNLYEKLKRESSPDRKQALAEKLAARLGELGLVLPLYQTMGRLYYPAEIRNLSVGRGFAEVPDVAEFRW